MLANLAFLDLRCVMLKVHGANQTNVERLEKEAYRQCCAVAGKLDTAQRLMVQSADDAGMPLERARKCSRR